LTVEKGLLREVSIAQKVCNRLLDLFFAYFSDNTQDEMAMTAFRMALKDMLAIYAAINEGVINILEHYFEMSKPDATRALDIYKRFCVHTEKIVAYMSSAKKVSFSLAVPIPNLRHAPVSLAGALQEYLDDPNFENNRLEYKENKRIVDSGGSVASKAKAETTSVAKKSITIQEPAAEEKAKPVKPPTSNQAIQDFFGSIETDQNQMSMFAGQQQQQYFTGTPQLMPQSTGYNPFMNGGAFMMPQQTGFMMPQQTGFMPMQQTGFLQPQMTGYNPFRQSVMAQPTGTNGFSPSPTMSPAPGAGPSTQRPSSPISSLPVRSATAPIKPLSAQKTGSRNPFAPPPGERMPTPPPAGPKGPSLRELATGGMGSSQGPSAGGGGNYGLGASAWSGNANGQQQQQPQSTGLQPQKTGLIGSVASEFFKSSNSAAETNNAFASASQPLTPSPAPDTTSNTNDFNASFSTLSMQSSQPNTSQAAAPLQPQATGFGGSTVKPFQPTSTFGASLLSPSPGPISPNMTGNPFANMSNFPSTPSQQPSAPFSASTSSLANANGTNGVASQPTGFGSSLFGNGTSNGVAAQPTGFGSSLFASSTSNGGGNTPQLTAQPTGFGGSTIKPFQPSSAFGSAAFANLSSPMPQQQQPQQQPQRTGSLF